MWVILYDAYLQDKRCSASAVGASSALMRGWILWNFTLLIQHKNRFNTLYNLTMGL